MTQTEISYKDALKTTPIDRHLVRDSKERAVKLKQVELDGKQLPQKKINYFLLLELLRHHENFADCKIKKCVKCKEITVIGKTILDSDIGDYELPEKFENFTPEMYMDLHTEGIKDIDISNLYNLKRGAIARFKKKHHIMANKRVTSQERNEWEKLFEQGVTVEDIAVDYGVAKETVNIYRTKLEEERGEKFVRTRKTTYTKVGIGC